MTQVDFIVVGAGSAGCMLASQLAHEHGFRVLLVEPESQAAPQPDRLRPARWLNLLGSCEDWGLTTEPNAELANRKIGWPRGRGLGGSSRINAMIWFPPTERDFQTLVSASDGKLSEAQLRKAYQKAEAMVQPEQPRWISDSGRAFIDSVSEMADATPMIYQRVNRQGRRWNPASLLEPNETQNGNGAVEILRATVDQIVWDGDKAVGVCVSDQSTTTEINASRGVILSAGTIATPTILMRSGIGERDQLAKSNIDVRVDQICVGKNLQDHLLMPVIFQTKFRSVFSAQTSTSDVARWQVIGAGPLASNLAECGGLFAGDRFQIHTTPTNYLTYPKPHADSNVMTLGVNVTQPNSNGEIELVDRSGSPKIHSRYFDDPSDLDAMVEGVFLARSLAQRSPLCDSVESETLPGEKRNSKAGVAKAVARYAQTLYHPVGSCRLGSQPHSVVDMDFTVRGTEQLWVVDASVLPRLTIGNPNAMVMTLAMMAAERINLGAC